MKSTKRTRSASQSDVRAGLTGTHVRDLVGPNTGMQTVYSAVKASAVVNPSVAKAAQLIKQFHEPFIPGSLNRLKMWFMRMEEGNRADFRTPIYANLPRDAIVRGLLNRVKRPNGSFLKIQSTIPSYGRSFWEVEGDQKENIGPQSPFLPWSLDGPDKLKAVMSDKRPSSSINWDAFQAAWEDVAGLLPRGSVHRIAFSEAITGWGGNAKYALDEHTNAGFPSWVKGWYHSPTSPKPASEAQELSQKLIISSASQLYNVAGRVSNWKQADRVQFIGTASQRVVQKGSDPFKRNSSGKLKSKRVVIAMPKVEAVAGKSISVPLQEALAKVRNPESGVRVIPAWSPMPVLDKNVQNFLAYADAHDRVPLSGDISNFDATLPPFVMWAVATAISESMDKETRNLFLMIMHGDVYGTGVLHPSGYMPATPSSVKSGSIFTSLVGCMANYFIQRYGSHAGYYRIAQQCVMGDDFILDGDGVNPESIARAFADFGMECNPSKQFIAPRMVHFLQRLHVLGYPGGEGSIFRILGSSLSLEDDTQIQKGEFTKYAFDFQALARLENANFNPYFTELVKYVSEGSSDRLGASLPAIDVQRKAGPYAQRRLAAARIKPWQSVGTGVPFEHWAVNRVLRGEILPPPGKDRFQAVYGHSYDGLAD